MHQRRPAKSVVESPDALQKASDALVKNCSAGVDAIVDEEKEEAKLKVYSHARVVHRRHTPPPKSHVAVG